MAAYKMTVLLNVHDDEDEYKFRLKHVIEQESENGPITVENIEREMRRSSPFYEEFLADVNSRVVQNDNAGNEITYEITSFEKLKED